MLSDCHFLLIYSFKVWTRGIWFIGYNCREHREICLITNQGAKATLLFDVAGRSGFHSPNSDSQMIHEWLIKYICTDPDCFSTFNCSTKGKSSWFFCRIRMLRVSEVEPSAGGSAVFSVCGWTRSDAWRQTCLRLPLHHHRFGNFFSVQWGFTTVTHSQFTK